MEELLVVVVEMNVERLVMEEFQQVVAERFLQKRV